MLIGDAAHSIHPLAGQGLNLSLKDCVSVINSIDNDDTLTIYIEENHVTDKNKLLSFKNNNNNFLNTKFDVSEARTGKGMGFRPLTIWP